ncbi:hypothetical protein K438DRAFT_2111099 [Mycena galopus ATCC 62051]|nr:hypothetical protein K438DRAFT_2111099 [Mycena galopus ATCC 62051]
MGSSPCSEEYSHTCAENPGFALKTAVLETQEGKGYYQNPPLETSTLDCVAANRTLPCILCLSRSNKILEFPAPLSTPAYPALISTSPSKTRSSGSGKLKLTKKERDTATISLKKFRDSIRLEQHRKGKFLEYPRTMFLTSTFQSAVLDKLLSISSLSDLDEIVLTWRHHDTHADALYRVILRIQSNIRAEREAAREARNHASRQKRAAKRKAEELVDTTDEEETEEETEGDFGSDFSFPDTLALPPSSTRSRPRVKSVDSAVRNAPTAAKRPRRVPARNHEDDEMEPDFPASIPFLRGPRGLDNPNPVPSPQMCRGPHLRV